MTLLELLLIIAAGMVLAIIVWFVILWTLGKFRR
jgi:hypothetical protein